MTDTRKQAQDYFDLVGRGVPPDQAFRQAFPNGLPSQADLQKDQAKDQQKQQIGAILGLPVGIIGGKYLAEQIAKQFGPEVVKEVAKQGASAVAGEAGATIGQAAAESVSGLGSVAASQGALEAPALIGAERVGEAAAAGTAPGTFSLGGVGGAGNALLPAAGALGAFDLFKNERTGGRGALQGAASGAALGSYFGPPGAVVGGGVGLLAGLLNRFGDKDMWKTEKGRAQKLIDQGYEGVPDYSGLTKGRSIKELVAIEEANKAAGLHNNVNFASSRLESDLTPEDIVGYSSIIEKAGKGATLADRLMLATQALATPDAVNEHHGTVDVDWSKVGQTADSASIAPQTTTRGDIIDQMGADRSKVQSLLPGNLFPESKIPPRWSDAVDQNQISYNPFETEGGIQGLGEKGQTPLANNLMQILTPAQQQNISPDIAAIIEARKKRQAAGGMSNMGSW